MKAFKKLAGLAEALAQEVPTGTLTGALPVRPAATQVCVVSAPSRAGWQWAGWEGSPFPVPRPLLPPPSTPWADPPTPPTP